MFVFLMNLLAYLLFSLCSVQCVVFLCAACSAVEHAVCSVQFPVYSVQCAVCSVQFAVCYVQRAVCSM